MAAISSTCAYKKLDLPPEERGIDMFVRGLPSSVVNLSKERISSLASDIVTSLGRLQIYDENCEKIARAIYECTIPSTQLRHRIVRKLIEYLKTTPHQAINQIALMLNDPESYFRPFTPELWKKMIPKIQEKTPGGVAFFHLCSHFAECPIPIQWVEPYCDVEHTIHASGREREKKITLFISMLQSYRILISDCWTNRAFHIPAKMSAIIRREDEYPVAIEALVRALDLYDLSNPDHWPILRFWQRHACHMLRFPLTNSLSSGIKQKIFSALCRIFATIDINFNRFHYCLKHLTKIQSRDDTILLCIAWGEFLSAIGHRRKAVSRFARALHSIDNDLYEEVIAGLPETMRHAIGTKKEQDITLDAELNDLDIWKSKVLSALGEEMYQEGNYDVALRLHRMACEKGGETSHDGIFQNRLAETLVACERYDEAISVCRRVSNCFPDVHLQTALMHETLGKVDQAQNNRDAALSHYTQAQEILESLYPNRKHPLLARIYTQLGALTGSYDNLIAAKQIQDIIFVGREHLDRAKTFKALAQWYYKQKNYPSSIEYYLKAYEVCLVLYPGKKHPTIARFAFDVGRCHQWARKFKQARQYYSRAIEIQRNACREQLDTTLAHYYSNMGVVLLYLHEHEQSLEKHQQAIAIQESLLNSNHPDLAKSYSNIGNTLKAMGENKKAFEYYQKAIAIRLAKGINSKKEVRAIVHSYEKIASIYKQMGNASSARAASQEARRYRELFDRAQLGVEVFPT